MTANGCVLFCYTMIISVQKLAQVIKSITSEFQRIKRHNRKILKRILKRPLKKNGLIKKDLLINTIEDM